MSADLRAIVTEHLAAENLVLRDELAVTRADRDHYREELCAALDLVNLAITKPAEFQRAARKAHAEHCDIATAFITDIFRDSNKAAV